MHLGHFINLFLPDCTDACPIASLPYIAYGLNFTIYAVISWGSVPYLINDQKNIATAYGIMTCIQNIGTTIMPIFIGYVKDSTTDVDYGYFWVEVWFTIFCTISIILKIILYKWDKKVRNGVLSSKDPYGML